MKMVFPAIAVSALMTGQAGYIPTVRLYVEGGQVDRGRLTVLDDPEVGRAAARYGDPDELLREDWIPEFDTESGRVVYPSYENELGELSYGSLG